MVELATASAVNDSEVFVSIVLVNNTKTFVAVIVIATAVHGTVFVAVMVVPVVAVFETRAFNSSIFLLNFGRLFFRPCKFKQSLRILVATFVMKRLPIIPALVILVQLVIAK